MADIVKTTVDKLALVDLELEAKPLKDSRPPLTAVLIKSIVKEIKDHGLGSGYGSVAKIFGLDKVSKFQVKDIHEKMKARVSELKTVDEPIELTK